MQPAAAAEPSPPGPMRAWAALVVLLLAVAAPAQETRPDKPEKPKPDRPIDESETAAERLRALLGLKKGPAAQEPQGQQGKEPPVQGPPPPPEPPVDETRRAAEILRQQLLPEAQPVVEPPPPPDERPLRPPPQEPGPPQEPEVRQRVLDDLERAAQVLQDRLLGEPGFELQGLPDAPPLPLRGSWSLRYRLRDRGQERDQDLVSILNLDYGDPDLDAVTAHFSGRLYGNLDGVEPTTAFSGIDQTFGDYDLRVYEAFADIHDLGPFSYLRLGRQADYEAPVEVLFDGARLEFGETGPLRLHGTLYAGVPNHLYESSADGDFLAGAAVGLRPWLGSRFRLDYLYAEDEQPGGPQRNDFFGLGIWQDIQGRLQLHGRYTWLEGESRDLRLLATTWLEEARLRLQVRYYELFRTQRQLVTELDPFFEQAFDSFPYRQLGAQLTQEFGEHLQLSAGADLRRLADASDEGQFNREFERWYLSPGVHDLLAGHLALSLTGELWHSDGERIETLGGELDLRAGDSTRLTLGTGYFLYKVDLFTGLERDHVRSYWLRLRQDLGPDLRLDGRYEFEDNDIDTFHTFRIGMTWTF